MPTRSFWPSTASISASPASLPAGTSLRIPAGGRADLFVDAERPVTLDVERGGSSGIMLGGDTVPAELSFAGPEFDVLDAASGTLPVWARGPYDVDSAQVLERLIRVVGGVPLLADTINGATFPSIQPIVVDDGDIVAVTIVNRGTETHPMHLHGHHMLVLSRNGVEVDGALWLDTVDVKPGRDLARRVRRRQPRALDGSLPQPRARRQRDGHAPRVQRRDARRSSSTVSTRTRLSDVSRCDGPAGVRRRRSANR